MSAPAQDGAGPAAAPDPTARRWLPLIIAAGAGLRFMRLSAQSYWYDEAVSARLGHHGFWELLSGSAKDLGNPPLHALVLHGWGRLVGDGDVALRVVSALAGVLSIPLVFVVGRRLVGARAALFAAAIFALSPFQVYLAQETRTYALVTLLVLASFHALLCALDRPRDRKWWALYAVTTALSLYGHYYAFFVVLGQVVFVLLWHRERARLLPFAASLLAAAVLYLPWLPSFYAQITTKGNLSRSADTWYLHGAASPLVFGAGTTLLWKGLAGPVRLALGAVGAVAFVGSALLGFRALRESRRARSLLLLWLLLPIGLPLLVSALAFPFYTVRYGLPATPAYYLFMGAGLAALRGGRRSAVAAAMAFVTVLSLGTYYTTRVKHDWRGVAGWIDAQARPADVVLFDADFNELSFARYARGPQRHLRLLPGASTDPGRLHAATGSGAAPLDVTLEVLAAPRVWVVLSDGDPDFDRLWEERLARDHRKALESRFRGIEARLWERGPSTNETP